MLELKRMMLSFWVGFALLIASAFLVLCFSIRGVGLIDIRLCARLVGRVVIVDVLNASFDHLTSSIPNGFSSTPIRQFNTSLEWLAYGVSDANEGIKEHKNPGHERYQKME